MGTADHKDPIIAQRAILHCPADIAFNHFVIESLLTSWLTKKANVELRVLGRYELYWTPDDPDKPNNSTHGCKILAFDRPHFLNFEWRGNAEQKEFMNNVRPLTNVTVLFNELGPGKTKVTLLHTGWRQGEKWDWARKYFVSAWSGAFRQLESLING